MKGENLTRKMLILFLLLPLLASCGGWTSKCTKRTTYRLAEEKTAFVGDEMVANGCFGVRYEPHGINRDLFNKTAYDSESPFSAPDKELIYSGRTGDTLHITYREYAHKEYIKPAFTQHVQYDLQSSDIVAFQGWTLQILEANNQTIRFKVVKDPELGEWFF